MPGAIPGYSFLFPSRYIKKIGIALFARARKGMQAVAYGSEVTQAVELIGSRLEMSASSLSDRPLSSASSARQIEHGHFGDGGLTTLVAPNGAQIFPEARASQS